LGVPFRKLNGSEPSFNLTGSHPTWGKAAPGLVFKQMALRGSAAPLFLIDEIDKPTGDRYPISFALLDLLERKNAENFTDEYFQVTFDASYAMWILTANTIEGVSDPLLSRVMTFNIPTPGVEQRKRIIKSEFRRLCKRVGIKVRIVSNDVIDLANRVDLDLRKVNRIVRDGVIEALRKRSKTAKFSLPPTNKRPIGFI
jgi:ATP-dependent Lon protease